MFLYSFLPYIITKFLLNIETKTLEKRITGRRVCEECNAIYNINDTAKAPQVESVCDKCGGKLYQRKDDNLESFQTRFAMYQEKTEPIIPIIECNNQAVNKGAIPYIK